MRGIWDSLRWQEERLVTDVSVEPNGKLNSTLANEDAEFIHGLATLLIDVVGPRAEEKGRGRPGPAPPRWAWVPAASGRDR